jgi:hypothetical protein
LLVQIWSTANGKFELLWNHETNPQPFKWWKLSTDFYFGRDEPFIGGSDSTVRVSTGKKVAPPVLKTQGEVHTMTVSQAWGMLAAAGTHNRVQMVKLPKGQAVGSRTCSD